MFAVQIFCNSWSAFSDFSSNLEKVYPVNITGSGDTIALRIADATSNPSYTLDTCVLEYKQNDRQ